MIKFLNLDSESFGLDINDSSFKIIKLREKRGLLQPVSFNEREIPKGVIHDGIIKDEANFVKILKAAISSVKGEKLRTKYVVASLPEEKSFSQVIKMPLMEKEELKSSVPFEAENYIPLPSDQVYLDFKKIEPIVDHLDHLDVFIVAVEKSIVDSYVSALRVAGLMPIALEVETQAITRAMVKNETSLSPIVLIDIGKDCTDFIVFSGRSIRFTCSIPISSQNITDKISEDLGVSLKEAEHLKIKYGFESNVNHRAQAASNSIKLILQALAKELHKYFDFYSGHDFHEHLFKEKVGENNIERIILSGGGANLKGLEAFFKNEFNIPCALADPWINFRKVPKNSVLNELMEKSLSYATALGLALRGEDKENE